MKRSIPRSVLEQMQAKRAEPDETEGQGDSAPGRMGGAWKAGAMAQVEGDLTQLRGDIVEAVLAGKRELSLTPDQIADPLGSDRRPDWEDTDAFVALKDSIDGNGQDVPVQVWPADSSWQPDPRDPLDASGQQFHLLSGRRRRAACAALGKSVRAVIMPPPAGASEAESRFAMMFHRFRENEAREDLSPFERLLSIGEIYEALAETETTPPTAVAFAERIGVHESLVSRARAVLRHRDAILNTFKTPYDMSFRALQDALAQIDAKGKKKPPKKPKPAKPLTATFENNAAKLKAKYAGGKLTIDTNGAELDAKALSVLLGKIAPMLKTKTPKKKGTPIVD